MVERGGERIVFVEGSQPAVTVQQITGQLGGADYLIHIPSNWNGNLIVYCRGYSHLLSDVNLIVPANSFSWMINLGFAFAESSYGAGGNCIKAAITCTHQLTEYVISKFGVTGKVYLVGISMGGNIALQLGAKYPALYGGILDICGAKNMISHYNDWMHYAGITNDSELADALIAKGFANPPPYPFSTVADFRKWCVTTSADFALTCEGTPDEKPQAYESISPIYSAAEIAVPTITVHGTADVLVPYSTSIDFMNAIKKAGNADLYRLYRVVGGQHKNSPVLAQIDVRLPQLIEWVENGITPPASI